MGRKRVVTSRPTRDGCKTCRYAAPLMWLASLLTRDFSFRRIKCDETRPRCSKCVSSGRECDFGIRLVSDGSSRVLLPAPARRRPLSSNDSPYLIGQSPNTPEWTCISSFANEEDRRAYDFFLHKSFDEIGSFRSRIRKLSQGCR